MAAEMPVRRTLVVHDLKRFREAVAFQDQIRPTIEYGDTLIRQVAFLLAGGFGDADELHIHNDSAVHSFGFSFRRDGKPVSLTGAIILHGGPDPYAVTLDQGPPRFFWSVHT